MASLTWPKFRCLLRNDLMIGWSHQELTLCVGYILTKCSSIILFEAQCLHQDLVAKEREIQRLQTALDDASRLHQAPKPKLLKPVKETSEELLIETICLY